MPLWKSKELAELREAAWKDREVIYWGLTEGPGRSRDLAVCLLDGVAWPFEPFLFAVVTGDRSWLEGL